MTLKRLAAFALAGLVLSAAAAAQTPDPAAARMAAQTAAPAAPASLERSLSFYNTHNGEHLTVVYRRGDDCLPDSLEKIKHILRDPFDGEECPVDPGLLDFLYDVVEKAGYVGEVHVVCGYRSVRTNTLLHNRSKDVVLRSRHLQGRALDFRLPGFDTLKLYEIAKAMERGGTGYYRQSDFIQIDTGPVRSW
ncbi:MAG: DUF882 domain-containing protein [Acidobacteriota bacterium]